MIAIGSGLLGSGSLLDSGSMVVMGSAALRSAAAAAAVGGGLWALRVRSVAAQKAAWTLVLAGAIAMPVLASWAGQMPWLPKWIPDAATLTDAAKARIAAMRAHRVEAAVGQNQAKASAVYATSPEPVIAGPVIEDVTPTGLNTDSTRTASARMDTAPAASVPEAAFASHEMEKPLGPQYPAPEMTQRVVAARSMAVDVALALYLAIAGALLLRLLYGLAAAMRMWEESYPIELGAEYDSIHGRVRVHNEITSPVTIGSGIVLPAEFAEWENEKLRIVLAHEGEHVRQGDFYLQLAAEIYAAIFWFSPLGWWLKRKLSDLGEAISDHAAVHEAKSRLSYAKILLEFATQPYATQMGVAMARGGEMTKRMERLLNETRFQQAFAGGRRRVLAAIVLAPLAVFAATALARVEAKAQTASGVQQAAPTSTQAPATGVPQSGPTSNQAPAQEPDTGVAHPGDAPIEAVPTPGEVPVPTPAPAPAPVVAPVPPLAPQAPAAAPDVRVSVSQKVSVSQNVSVSPKVSVSPNVSVSVDSSGSAYSASYPRAYDYAYTTAQDKDGYNRDSYAVVSKNGQHVRFSGDYHSGMMDKARAQAHGDNFLWFTRDGKEYIVDDPQVMARIHSIYQPMEALGDQMKVLGKQQKDEADRNKAELDREMAQFNANKPELDKQMAEFRAQRPELEKQMVELNEQMAHISIPKMQPIDPKQFEDLKREMAELKFGEPDFDEKMAELSAKMATLRIPKIDPIDEKKMAEINAKISEAAQKFSHDQAQLTAKSLQYRVNSDVYKRLSERMSKIGEQQGKLGGEMGHAAHDADQKIRSIIDESLKNGAAKPVQ
jgi:beta-lactamase regulating signal transducer with metallopeptidase domain